MTAIAKYGISTIRHFVNKCKTIPLEVLQEREALCQNCRHNVANVCELCKCPTQRTLRGYKLERPHEECPIGRWKKWTPGIYHLWRSIFRTLPDVDDWPAQWHTLADVRHAFRDVLQERLKELNLFGTLMPEQGNRGEGRGILILGGGPKYGIGVYVSCRMARHHGWTGPIQVWHRGEAEALPAELFRELDVDLVDALQFKETHPCRRWGMDQWGNPDNRWLSWGLKSYAALHCPFREVLYLDADAYLLGNPEQLFDNNPAGSVIWHDLPGMATNLQWNVYGIEPDAGPGWQGGQWLIDKARAWPALQLYRWLDDWSDFTYHYGYGDQDNLRLAWKATKTPHHVYTYHGTTPHVQPKHGCLRAYGPNNGEFIICHRVPDKGFNTDLWAGYRGSRLRKRNRFPDEDLVHEYAETYRRRQAEPRPGIRQDLPQ